MRNRIGVVVLAAVLGALACNEATKPTEAPAVAPTAPPAVSSPAPVVAAPDTTCKGPDLRNGLTFVIAEDSVTVTVRNPYDHDCGSVLAILYNKILSDRDQTRHDFKPGTLPAKGAFTATLARTCDAAQLDVILGTEAPTQPRFAPGYFIGYTPVPARSCPTPRPSPSPSASPSPRPTPTPSCDAQNPPAFEFLGHTITPRGQEADVTAQIRVRNLTLEASLFARDDSREYRKDFERLTVECRDGWRTLTLHYRGGHQQTCLWWVVMDPIDGGMLATERVTLVRPGCPLTREKIAAALAERGL